ncbi:hypothetical protein M8C21_008548, partial [Ambrosia artemisiifolia]
CTVVSQTCGQCSLITYPYLSHLFFLSLLFFWSFSLCTTATARRLFSLKLSLPSLYACSGERHFFHRRSDVRNREGVGLERAVADGRFSRLPSQTMDTVQPPTMIYCAD